MTSRDILENGCNAMGINVTEKICEDLDVYFRELAKWNKKMNLVAKADRRETIESHFLDSLVPLPRIASLQNPTLLDVGTGAGFPGLVLKTACRSLKLCLIEPRVKRVTFLRHMVRTLRLEDVVIQARRLEQHPQGNPQQHPCITSRAVTTINEFLQLVEASSPPGGIVICMKGPKAQQEIRDWQRKSPNSPFLLEERQEWSLPFSGAKRELVIFKKNECRVRRNRHETVFHSGVTR